MLGTILHKEALHETVAPSEQKGVESQGSVNGVIFAVKRRGATATETLLNAEGSSRLGAQLRFIEQGLQWRFLSLLEFNVSWCDSCLCQRF